MNRLLVGLLSFAVLIVMTTCRDDQSFRVPTAVSGPPAADLAAGTGPVTLVGAGNIAKCGQVGDAATWTTRRPTRAAISAISAPRRATPSRATTATTPVPGTSWC